MIISNSDKYIFIHIPKCGGTTVAWLLNRRLRAQDVTLNLNPHDGWAALLEAYHTHFGLMKHSTAEQICQGVGGIEFFRDYYVFAISRNPYARAYSAFKFTKSSDQKYRPTSKRYQEIKDMNLEEFLRSKYIQERRLFQSRSQLSWIRGVDHKIHVWKLETLDDEIGELMRRLGINDFDPSEMRRMNVSNPSDAWQRNITDKSAMLVRDLYAEDFEYFGYPTTYTRLEA